MHDRSRESTRKYDFCFYLRYGFKKIKIEKHDIFIITIIIFKIDEYKKYK